jgi:hypothetical protein
MRLRTLAIATVAAAAFVVVSSSADAAVVINDLFDSTITSASNASEIESAIGTASSTIGSMYSNNTQVNIYFEYIPGSFLGASESTIYSGFTTGNYNFLSSLNAAANPSNAYLAEGLAHIASGNGADPNTTMIATSADLRALGLNTPGGFNTSGQFVGAGGTVDAVIALSSSFGNDFNYTENIPAYNGSNLQYSAINTVEHEIDEVLGGGGAGSTLNAVFDGINEGGDIGPLDRFRYAAPGVPSFTTSGSATSYFSLDGGVTNIVGFNQDHNGDYADFGPNTQACSAGGFGGPMGHIQDAFTCNNQPFIQFGRNSAEDAMLQSIGWDPSAAGVPETATWSMMLLGIGLMGSLLRRRSPRVAA